MRGRFGAILIVAAILAPSGGSAMTPPRAVTIGHCTITGGESLPAGSGGNEALCAAIERAVAARAPTARYTVQVKVLPRSRLSAVLVVNGRTLPEQKFAVMDRELNSTSIERFADSLADQVAEAARAGAGTN
jgi:hypothetical protein